MTTFSHPRERIFVALDTTDVDAAQRLADCLVGQVGGIKLGKEFFSAHGPEGVRRLAGCGLPVFLDLKFHDIPNTVAGALRAVLPLTPFMVNVHASGGHAMMQAAAQAVASAEQPRPILLGVTVLTSLAAPDLHALGIADSVETQVRRLAKLAQTSGLDGVVCSAREIASLRAACGDKFVLLTPGIRPAWSSPDDQKRIVTPAEAVRLGADYLVIGRPITRADDPRAAAIRIADELQQELA